MPVRWLWAAFTLRFMLGDLKRTRQVSEQALAISVFDPTCLCEAHHAMGGTLSSLGGARGLEAPFRGGAGRLRRAASAALRPRLGPGRVRARVVLARSTTAPRRRAVAIAWNPATPAPITSTLAGGMLPAAVVSSGMNLAR